MARVTVEDCVERVSNRFQLVMLAAQRARDISAGARETVSRDNDKNPVIALREIADETVELDTLREALVQGMQKHLPFDDFEEDEDVPLSVLTEAVASEAEGVQKAAEAEDEEQDSEADDVEED